MMTRADSARALRKSLSFEPTAGRVERGTRITRWADACRTP